MRIHLYAACWNDRPMLPFFIRHYACAERVVVYDDHSSDDSASYLTQIPHVECRTLERRASGSTIESLRQLHNECWKESRGQADWVIVVAVDEHTVHHNLPAYLADCQRAGVTIVPAVGYEMVSATFPGDDQSLSETVRRGVLFEPQHRVAIFQPDAIDEIHFSAGRHKASPAGRVCYPAVDEVRLLHFKHLGLDYVLARTAELATGLQSVDRNQQYGFHWLRTRAAIEADFADLLDMAREVDLTSPFGLDGWALRWWRRQRPWYMRYWDRRRYARALAAVTYRPGG
ncbi:MAG: glycosyltransferase family 2 protein [Acidobacteriota bacterium]